MSLMQKKTPEQRAEEARIREQRQEEAQARKRAEEREAEARKHAESAEKARRAFLNTPAGRARTAFERGDQVFQYAIDVMSQQAVIVAMMGSTTTQTTTDPVEILNSVCREGWDLVNGSFVFIEQGQQSRDKFMSSGQNVAIKGATVGYYLFRRCEANRREPAKV
ncbi:MAG: hypothetical protein ACM3ML_33355 [Micromonosporaceae bacterium]